MGHPRKIRKKYAKPFHPWQKERIDEEKVIIKEFGLKKKKEIWRVTSLLGKFKSQAKKLSALHTEQSQKETKQLMDRLRSFGLVPDNASFDDVLGININAIMARRLQSIVVAKKLARSHQQARQMITHNHIKVGEKIISSPSYLVKIGEENLVEFAEESSFKNEDHPERMKKGMEEIKEEVKKIKEDMEKKKEKPKWKKERRPRKQEEAKK